MNFLDFYNWLRFSLLTPSFFFKNRFFIERHSKNRLIFSMLTSTQKNTNWRYLNTINIHDYHLKTLQYLYNIYAFIFVGLSLLLILYLLNGFNIINFPIKYECVYLWWRIWDISYFVILQFQCIILTGFLYLLSIIAKYLLMTNFNVFQFIVFNYSNKQSLLQLLQFNDLTVSNTIPRGMQYWYSYSNTVLPVNWIDVVGDNYYKSNIVYVIYYYFKLQQLLIYYPGKTCLVNVMTPSSTIGDTSIWHNFIYFNSKNIVSTITDLCSLESLTPATLFLSLNHNSLLLQQRLLQVKQDVVLQLLNTFKITRWYTLMLYSNSWDSLIIKNYDMRLLLNLVDERTKTTYQSDDHLISLYTWYSSIEWLLFKWQYVLNLSNLNIIYTPNLTLFKNSNIVSQQTDETLLMRIVMYLEWFNWQQLIRLDNLDDNNLVEGSFRLQSHYDVTLMASPLMFFNISNYITFFNLFIYQQLYYASICNFNYYFVTNTAQSVIYSNYLF
jgi:hypothetical protein